MADELDPIVESRLRQALQAEADAIPFTLRADTVRRVGAERRKARRAQWATLLAAAAVLVVAVVGIAALSTLRSPDRIASPRLNSLPSYEGLAKSGHGKPELGRQEGEATTQDGQWQLGVPEGTRTVEVVVACTGPSLDIGTAGADFAAAGSVGIQCGGQPVDLRGVGGGALASDPSPSVLVRARAGTAFRLIVLGEAGAGQTPSASPRPVPTATPSTPAGLPSNSELLAFASPGAVQIGGTSVGNAPQAAVATLPGLANRVSLAIVTACTGGGPVDVSLVTDSGQESQLGQVGGSACDGKPAMFGWPYAHDPAGATTVKVNYPGGTSWTAILVDRSRVSQDPAASPLPADTLPSLPDVLGVWSDLVAGGRAAVGTQIASVEQVPGPAIAGTTTFGDIRVPRAWRVLVTCLGGSVTVAGTNASHTNQTVPFTPICDGTAQTFAWVRGASEADIALIDVTAQAGTQWSALVLDATAALAPTTHPTPTVPCRAPGASIKTAPKPTLYQGATALGTVTYYTSNWGATSDDGVPTIPTAAVEATADPLVLRIAGDVCATRWSVVYGTPSAGGVGVDPVGLLAIDGAPAAATAGADTWRENRISLAGLPSGDWVLEVRLGFENGGGVGLIRVHVP